MSLSNLWKPDKIELGGSLTFQQFETQGIDPAMQEVLLRPAGHPHPMAIASQQQQPILEFSTPQLDVLAGIPVSGKAYTADSYLYFKQAAAEGTSGATARSTETHARIVVSQVMVYWTSITLPNRGQAIANVVVCAVFDGTNDPLVHGGSVALSGNLDTAKQFGCGPCVIDATSTVDMEPEEMTINSGVELHKEGCASELWDSIVSLKMSDPSIEVVSKSKLAINSFGLSGDALDGSDGLIGWARQTGPRVSNATTSHVKIQATDGLVFPGRASTQDGLWTDRIRVRPVSPDDTTEPIVLTSGQAIA